MKSYRFIIKPSCSSPFEISSDWIEHYIKLPKRILRKIRNGKSVKYGSVVFERVAA